jgi:hypothetical protein
MFETSRKTRMQLPFQNWPAGDRIRWESAFKTGDRFDESGRRTSPNQPDGCGGRATRGSWGLSRRIVQT